jgi:cyanophycinase
MIEFFIKLWIIMITWLSFVTKIKRMKKRQLIYKEYLLYWQKKFYLFFLVLILFFTISFFEISCKKEMPTGPTPPSQIIPDIGYKYYCTGNQGDVNTFTAAGFALMGGGSDVDEAFRWMIQRSGGGDFVVIRASGTDAYNPYISQLGAVDSVETLIIYSRDGAENQFVVEKVRRAEALFIAGGDQADYIRFWKGTALNEALNFLINRGIPVGGTSAGLAVLGEFIFAALNGTVYSSEALDNPYNFRITLETNFLYIPVLRRIITDSHFAQRDRMGRLIVFLARILKDGWATVVRGIGIDEATALLVESDGWAQLAGRGAAYFLQADHQPEVCQPAIPLTFSRVPVYKIQAGGFFNLLTWQGNGGVTYYLSVDKGKLSSSLGSIY